MTRPALRLVTPTAKRSAQRRAVRCVRIGPRRSVVGTVLGKPTYAELQDLVNVQRFNLSQLDSVKACPAWAAADPAGYGAWAASLFDATAKMNATLTSAQGQIDLVPASVRSVVPVVSPLMTKNAWEQVLAAAQPFHAIVSAFTKAGYCPWPTSPAPPQPTAPDFDLQAYQWTGKALTFASGFGSVALLVGAYLLLKDAKL